MVVMFLFSIEIPLSYYPDPRRFSPGWYTVRIIGLISGGVVLSVLLYETRRFMRGWSVRS